MRIFKSHAIINHVDNDELLLLEADFSDYKTLRVLPENFGRDALYDHPHTLPVLLSEEVSHLHLADTDTTWSIFTPQNKKTSDTHLVYCQGSIHDDHFLFIDILQPNAHQQAHNNNIMYKIGIIAEKFRLKH